jgi:hypothetical protein
MGVLRLLLRGAAADHKGALLAALFLPQLLSDGLLLLVEPRKHFFRESQACIPVNEGLQSPAEYRFGSYLGE